jgi:acetyl-CoA carboxylase biotin carboxylase subunit
MFRKVLVANRGEIAVRVMRALRELRIRSVGIYSSADRGALHVRYAGEAHEVGPAPAAESYLRIDRILEVARRAGCDALHPGYGFLSERAELARACAAAGVAFIGPPPEAIDAMGSKTGARARMTAAGVPVVPGTEPLGADPDAWTRAATGLGYPVLVKAAAGGGGKGMRAVAAPADLADAVARARSEAQNAFGDSTVYMEKLVQAPHHVEIQVLGLADGTVLHLWERECSIQRRHQKIVEETPSPLLDEGMRAAMGAVAVRAAAAVGYRGAGTVEFLVDGRTREFFFLEMNTRLQVEHPITEMVTGIDLVQAQVRIAAGEALGLRQEDLARRGTAMECRVYAEDPSAGFMPSPGRIVQAREPGGVGVRVDSGIYPGAEVPSLYDPLLAKVVAWGETREVARQRMARALAEYVVTGVRTNLAYLAAVVDHAAFRAGDYDTGFVDRWRDELLRESAAVPPDLAEVAALTAAVAAYERDRARGLDGGHAGGSGAGDRDRSDGAGAPNVVSPSGSRRPSPWKRWALP